MSLPINTLEGINKRVEALKKILDDDLLPAYIGVRAEERLRYWEKELENIYMEKADKYIDNILDELE